MAFSRSAHTKSRNGCLQCKRRRVKCDERPPTCGLCSSRGVKCEFQDLPNPNPASDVSWPASNIVPEGSKICFEFDPLSTGAFQIKNTLTRQPPQRKRRRPEDVSDRLPSPARSLGLGSQVVYPNLGSRDTELLHHFVTATSHTFMPRAPMDQYLIQLLPASSQSNEAIKHALLGISALHVASLHSNASPSRYVSAALEHLHKGAMEFRTTVDQLKPQNSNVVFAYSGLSIIWEFALLHPTYEMYCGGEQHLIDRLLQVFILLRKVMMLWQSLPAAFYQAIPPKPRIAQGLTNEHKSKTMESKLRRVHDSGLVPEELAAMTQRLHELNFATTTDPGEQRVYAKAIDLLHVTFYKLVKHPGEWTLALRWPFNIPVQMIEFLRARTPLAMVLLCHYCALLHLGTTQWWMRDWAKSVLSLVFDGLDEQWTRHLSWPAQVIEGGNKSLLSISLRRRIGSQQ